MRNPVEWGARLVWLGYVAVLAAAIAHHEPWFDEAQAWLIARDASLSEIWLRLLHYEGTPGLWQTLLRGFAISGMPYLTLSVFSGMLAAGSAWLILRASPFPLLWRCLLPFTYFLGYQYAVVARSYVLIPLLLFCIAICYPRRQFRRWLFAALLSLLAATSAHGTLLSGIILVYGKLESKPVKWVALEDAMVLAVCLGGLCASWSAPDHAQIHQINLSLVHVAAVTAIMLREAMTGSILLTAIALLLSLPYLWRGRTLGLFLASTFVLGIFGAVVYSNVWHQGLIFLVWVMALWIAGYRARFGPATSIGLAVVVCVQLYWTAASIRYDWAHNYSASRSAAVQLRDAGAGATNVRIYSLGAACMAIQPYFRHNIFSNYAFHSGAYWDWSSKNPMNEAITRVSKDHPDYVVTGIKGDADEVTWRIELERAGYRLWRHIRGAVFWKFHPYEPEAFDIYRRALNDSVSHRVDNVIDADFDSQRRILLRIGCIVSPLPGIPNITVE